MQINSGHNFIIYNFFKLYTLVKIRRHFKKVIIEGEITDHKKPILLISNHISWWDGFWAMYLNLKIFRRKLYFMMLKDQLERFWFFKYSGGYPVMKGTKSIIETLNYTGKLLSDGHNLVLIFPQGKIQSVYQDVFSFESGVEKIIRDNPGIQVVMVVYLLDYYSNPKPTLFIYLREFHGSSEKIEEEYNDFYSESVSGHKEVII